MKRKYLAFSLIFFLLGYGYYYMSSSPTIDDKLLKKLIFQAQNSSHQLKIMSYNIRSSNLDNDLQKWDNRKSKVFNLISIYNPDIIATQEGLVRQLKEFENEFKSEYESTGYLSDKREDFENLVIFFRRDKLKIFKSDYFWLSETPKKDYSKSWDAMFPRLASYAVFEMKSNNNRFLVINAHLDHMGFLSREKSLGVIINYLKENLKDEFEELPLLLLGDFNEAPFTKGYNMLRENESFVDIKENCEHAFQIYKSSFHYYYGKIVNNPLVRLALFPAFSYHSKTFPKWDNYHIDWILSRNGKKLEWKHILFHMPDEDIDNSGVFASDHFPLFAIVEMKK